MLCAGFLDKGIEATSAEVAFDLPIPPLCFELREPLAETTKLLGRELADGPLELFNGHIDSLPEGALSPARAPHTDVSAETGRRTISRSRCSGP